jgi:hypothetical protein
MEFVYQQITFTGREAITEQGCPTAKWVCNALSVVDFRKLLKPLTYYVRSLPEVALMKSTLLFFEKGQGTPATMLLLPST